MGPFFNSDSEDEDEDESDSEEEKRKKDVMNDLKSKVKTLQFRGSQVHCPFCSNKAPLLDLQALHQHGDQSRDPW